MAQDYRELDVWKLAMELVVECYAASKRFPDDEKFGLVSQLRRAAVSVPANIAEGQGRGMTKAFINHLWIATGSLKELETHLVIANRLQYLDRNAVEKLFEKTEKVGRMLTGLRRSIEQRL